MPTLARTEQVLIGRVPASALTGAGVLVTGPSPIAALADPISVGLGACGVNVADPTAPTDDDLNRLTPANWYKFADIAELRFIENVYTGLLNRVDAETWPDYSYRRSVSHLNDVLRDKRRAVALLWGYGLGKLETGTVDLGFVPHWPEF